MKSPPLADTDLDQVIPVQPEEYAPVAALVDAPLAPTSFSMKAVGRTTALLAAGALVGQAIGLLRSLFIANKVGISASFDAILIAIVIPTIAASFLTTSMRVALMPTYIDIAQRSGEAAARRFIGGLLSYAALAGVAAAVLVVAFAGPSVFVAGPGLGPDARQLAIAIVPIYAPMLFCLAMSNLLIAVCQIGRSYLPIAASTALGPSAAIVVTLVFWDRWGIVAYAVGTTVGAAAALIILVGTARWKGFLPPLTLRMDRAELGPFARYVLPMAAGSALLQTNLISDRAIATLISSGAVSALKYGQQIVTEPLSALSNSWNTVIYPAVVQASEVRSTITMGAAMTVAMRYTLAIFTPLTVATVAFAPLVVDVIYGRGAFGPEAVHSTVTVVAAFAPMLLLTMIQPVFIAAHNARRRGTLMAVTSLANAILNVLLNVLFGTLFGVAGIALSSSVTLALLLIFLAWRVPEDEGFRMREVTGTGVRALVASLIPGIPIAFIVWSSANTDTEIGSLAMLIGGALLGAAGYLLATRVLRLPEPAIIVGALRRSVISRLSLGHAA